MSENIQSISNGTYTLGDTNKLTFSAGPGIRIDEPSEGTVRIGNDETVLWETTANNGAGVSFSGATINLDESWFDFQKVQMYLRYFNDEAGQISVEEFVPSHSNPYQGVVLGTFNDAYAWSTAAKPFISKCSFHTNSIGTTLYLDDNWILDHSSTAWSERKSGRLYKVIGINRISGSNA